MRCQKQNQPCEYLDAPRFVNEGFRSDGWNSNLSPNVALPQEIPGTSRRFAADIAHLPPGNDALIALSDEDTPEEPVQKDQYGHFHGGASGFVFLHIVKQRLARLPSMSLDFSDYPIAETGKFPSILPPKSIADALVRNYFDFGLTTSRFVHRPTLEATYEKLYLTEEWSSMGQGELAVVYMVLAMGSHYSDTNSVFTGFSASVRYLDMAQKELQKESSRTTLGSLQARLLVTHWFLNHSRMHEAWSTFGLIVRQAQALQLHRHLPQSTNNNQIEYEYRKRLFWSIYIYDRILSSIFGRPCALHDDDIDQEECALANDEDISATSCRLTNQGFYCSAAALLYYTRLARILGQVLSQLYSPAGRSHGLRGLQRVAVGCEQSLAEWQKSLPTYLDYNSLPPEAMSIMTQRQMCTLKLTFTHTQLLLYRPFILYSIGSSQVTSPQFDQWIRHCYKRSIDAAKVTVAECRHLYKEGLMTRAFWLVNYVQFAAIGTLYMYSILWPDDSQVRQVAEEAMSEFPVGVEGDLLGQRYLEVLKELREITGGQNATTIDQAVASVGATDMMSMFEESFQDASDPWANLFSEIPLIGNYNPGDFS
ncbi:Fungal specific transcription factor domain-containing protein [Cladophialophora immunda]|nr:Fungal specific transcription factor domain-containing protein [Cladophialophora immunda]